MSKFANMAAGKGISTVSPVTGKMVVSANLEIPQNWSMSKLANMAAGERVAGGLTGSVRYPCYRR